MTYAKFALQGLCFALFLVGASAWAGDPPSGLAVGETTVGKVLTDASGFSLYVFDKDKAGESACYEKCAEIWPPAKAPAGVAGQGDFAPIKRADGVIQWSYKGKPLYTYNKDKVPGDIGGDGVRDVWHLAKP